MGEPMDGQQKGGAPSGELPAQEDGALTSELEECFALLVRALFVTSIDPLLPEDERWRAYVSFPHLPWDPRPEDIPVQIPDPS